MSQSSKALPRLAFVGGIACLTAAGVTWARWPTAGRTALARYSAAACVSPTRASDKRFWNSNIPLGSDKSVRVLATGEMRTMFELHFSDEDYRRQATTFWDYSYPSDARISRSTNTLWLVVAGGLGFSGLLARWSGLSDRARLYEYDLGTRTIAHEFDLQLEAFPAWCPASTVRDLPTRM